MNRRSTWKLELKWWLSAFAALVAVLSVFALIKVVLSVTTIKAADLDVAGVTNPYGDALGKASWWVVAVLVDLWAFLFAAALSFRLLVPTFVGAPPRIVAGIVMTWPVVLGVFLIGADVASMALFAAVGIAWAMVTPMDRKTVLTDEPVKGGVLIGLSFGVFAELVGAEWAILWCAIRLYRGKSIEVTATAMCAAMMPALFLVSQTPRASLKGSALYLSIELMVLAVLALAGFIRYSRTGDEDDEAEDASEVGEAAES